MQNPNCVEKSKIQNPNFQNPNSKIRNPKSKQPRLGPLGKNGAKIQNPRSKIQTALWNLDLGWPGWGWRRWPCSKRRCMAIPPTRIWLRPRPNWAPISCWKSSPDFQPRVVEIGTQFPEKRRTRWCGKTPALGVQLFECAQEQEATNCFQQSFAAIPVETKWNCRRLWFLGLLIMWKAVVEQ